MDSSLVFLIDATVRAAAVKESMALAATADAHLATLWASVEAFYGSLTCTDAAISDLSAIAESEPATLAVCIKDATAQLRDIQASINSVQKEIAAMSVTALDASVKLGIDLTAAAKAYDDECKPLFVLLRLAWTPSSSVLTRPKKRVQTTTRCSRPLWKPRCLAN
ncbi:hypothetical protein BC831DRAFT_482394, partial [Entophlyctis helioformis]